MNENIRAILIDDEPFCTAGLAIELQSFCPNVEVIAVCNTAKDGLQKIKSLQPDVVFLDIEMPWMNGFELIELLQPINFEIIFVTAYNEFAVQAFRLSAVDYLMKPIDTTLLREAVDRLEGRRASNEIRQQKVAQLLSNIQYPISNKAKISVPNSDGLDLISIDEILYCKASSSYTEIVLSDGSVKLVSRVLKDIAFQLEFFNFLRIHQSYLINIEHLKSFHRSDGGFVEMINGAQFPVSRGRKQELIDRLK
jgi:two-component system, LytTR family, response regulator